MKKKVKLSKKVELIAQPFDWSTYNQTQMAEKLLFIKLASDLAHAVIEPQNLNKDVTIKTGRKPLPLGHRLFCILMRTYDQKSSRRSVSDISLESKNCALLQEIPHFNSILNYFNDKRMTLILKALVEITALPLKGIETRFAVDSTGFSLRMLDERWSYAKLKHINSHRYLKAHVMYGVKSNIAVGCEVTKGTDHDSPQFRPLIEKAAKHFNLEEISADKAYSSRGNVEATFAVNAFPLIPFKRNAKSQARRVQGWNSLFHYFKKNNEEFMQRYHQRSNAESGFSMIKARFNPYVRARNIVGQTNEILAKIVAHNLCVLIQEMFLSNVKVNLQSTARTHFAQKGA